MTDELQPQPEVAAFMCRIAAAEDMQAALEHIIRTTVLSDGTLKIALAAIRKARGAT